MADWEAPSEAVWQQVDLLKYLIDCLYDSPPMERAAGARALYDRAHAVVATIRDEAVCQALLETVDTPEGRRRRSHRMAAEELGLKVAAVNSIVTRHRNWLRNVARRG